jgi:hypothetical protein
LELFYFILLLRNQLEIRIPISIYVWNWNQDSFFLRKTTGKVELEFLHKSKESPNTDTYAQNKRSAPQKIYPLTVGNEKENKKAQH